MSEECDISCLSQENSQQCLNDNCSNFESESCMSVGMEQNSLFKQKTCLAEPIKCMTKKNIKF